jgi:hypothetical protein
MSDPYATENIPPGDLYADVPLYGRYKAKDGDTSFKDSNPEELYKLCNCNSEMIPEFSEGRRVYAIGGLIVKGRHLESGVRISHEFGDLNEVAAIKLVQEQFPSIPVPTIYFQGKVQPLFERELTKFRSMATIC